MNRSTRIGIAQVFVRSTQRWESICSDGFDLTDARVFCRMMGTHPSAFDLVQLLPTGPDGKNGHVYVVSNLECPRSDHFVSIRDCRQTVMSGLGCSSGPARVFCPTGSLD